jgi:soluble P-type ATPase
MPDGNHFKIEYLVLDFNGTIAKDGVLLDGVAERLWEIAKQEVKIFIVTADTNGSVSQQCGKLPVEIKIHHGQDIAERKQELLCFLGPDVTAAVGNGKNDLQMLKESKLAITVFGAEGCFAPNFAVSDVVVNDILDALDLFIHQNRLTATLRS